jgi:hypothetical protein
MFSTKFLFADHQVCIGKGEAGVAFNCLLEAFYGIWVLLFLFVDVAQIVVGLSKSRIKFDRLTVVTDSLISSEVLLVENTSVIVGQALLGIHLYTFGEAMQFPIDLLSRGEVAIGNCKRIIDPCILFQIQRRLIPLQTLFQQLEFIVSHSNAIVELKQIYFWVFGYLELDFFVS